MITILDCIQRIPHVAEHIIKSYDTIFHDLNVYLENKEINEIVFIGSGTSNTSVVTSMRFVEEVSGMSVNRCLPNDFLNKKHFNAKALYVFVSQSGTSTLTNKASQQIKEKNLYHACICADPSSHLAEICSVYVDLGCGYEEYGMRTIGYVSTVLVEMLMGISIGHLYHHLSADDVENYLHDALKATDGIREMTRLSLTWYEKHRNILNQAEGIILYGGKNLWGVALEGALKILEITRNTLAIGYEMDDGCHGPTMGFTNKHAVIVFNYDERDNETAINLSNFAKNELGFGCIVGRNAKDECDLPFKPSSVYFYNLEFAPFMQVLAYSLALDKKTVLKPSALMEPLPEKKYFDMHEK